MSARSYDVILTVDNAAGFQATNVLIGNTSASTGTIANVDLSLNQIKVKLNNLQQEFSSSETVHSNVIITTTATGGDGLLTTSNFLSNVFSANSTTAITNVSSIAQSSFKAEKNGFTQNPIVRLYTIYYPGEWYPPNEAGNPTGQGTGKAWPNNFPIRFAEIVGDLTSDILYNVTYGGDSYIPFPVNSSTLSQGSEGTIDEISLEVFNVDNIITKLVEDPFFFFFNSSNSVVATVNVIHINGYEQ